MTKRKQHRPRVQGTGCAGGPEGRADGYGAGKLFWGAPDDGPSMEEGAARRGDGHLPAWPQPCGAGGGCRSGQGAACHSAGVTPRESASQPL